MSSGDGSVGSTEKKVPKIEQRRLPKVQAPAYEKEEEEIVPQEPFNLADAVFTNNRHVDREPDVMIRLKNEAEFMERLTGQKGALATLYTPG